MSERDEGGVVAGAGAGTDAGPASAPGAVPDAGPDVAPAAPPLPRELTLASGMTQAPRVPGSVGERFQRFPTGMVEMPAGAGVTMSGASVDGDEPHVAEWAPGSEAEASTYRGIAGWGLGFSIVGLAASFVVGWGFPIALVGLVTGAFALRRPTESRAIAGWALALGITGLIYSAAWLIFAATSTNLFG